MPLTPELLSLTPEQIDRHPNLVELKMLRDFLRGNVKLWVKSDKNPTGRITWEQWEQRMASLDKRIDNIPLAKFTGKKIPKHPEDRPL